MSYHDAFHARAKHVEIDVHFVRKWVALEELDVRHISIKFQLADVYTMALTISKFCSLRDKLVLMYSYAIYRGLLSQ